MRWQDEGRSSDLEDRRGNSGGIGGLPIGGAHIGIGGLILLVVLSLVFKRNFLSFVADTGAGDLFAAGERSSRGARGAFRLIRSRRRATHMGATARRSRRS